MSIKAQTMPPAGPGMSRLELFLQHWRAKILLFVGMRALARSVFEAILQKQPNDLLALNSMAYDAMQDGHMLQALGYFERARALSQDKSNAHFNHAFVSEALGRLDEAEVGFRAAIALEEKMDRAWYGLGLVLIRQGEFDDHHPVQRRGGEDDDGAERGLDQPQAQDADPSERRQPGAHGAAAA